ncbi:ATP-dependent DNA ligase LigD phosphoesterase module /ATP-dependent DNA ligase LigD polymerase module [Pseudomonas synxantha]|uniref:DNA ligase (ATP) n=1 Tax=Pseudomonas synxantha TaxID=47883 RepID=A0AAX3I789_9PSED|nr:DNA ligase D [Pseudomonas synxantha]AZE67016.1 ATP-dependent DNA ligase, LigD [Pseudomonas synxantha]KRP56076.1 ATP-dependent DNA ligase [Pseudomonas synxantha]SDU31525.1 ATP-dependent DNA ligase LigD phosphoesterase module /ATP-dependent DNA ligase LigD polymerase module [Pseudomonas synxantha]VTQ99791.1 DNA ligase D [Pseudomonas synxantha]
MAKPLSEYNRKRDFEITAEPAGSSPATKRKTSALSFVIQKHDARNLHYDFRLELDGVLLSWAVPKGPSLDPTQKRLAVHVEDHPLSYGSFEGSIPAGQYGAGDVIVWDRGLWQPHDDPHKAYAAGKLKFTLVGEKLSGDWALVRTRLKGSGDKEQWLLIKEKDQQARPAADYDIVQAQPDSVLSDASVGKVKAASKTRKAAKPKKATSALPDQFSPQLATLVDRAPAGDWLYEIKFDGYRMLARIRDGEVRLFTRNGNDWTERLPRQVKALEALKLKDSWLDGEVVSLNADGLPDFQALQNAFDIGRSLDIVYYLFDAPFLDGQDLRNVAVEERRAALKAALSGSRSKLLRFSEAFAANQRDIFESACDLALEGVIGKRAGSLYVSSRSADWIKLKCRLRQEFVIVGYTRPQGSRSGFGALLLAVNDDNGLVYAGRVGTGFDQAALKSIYAKLTALERKTSPLEKPLTSAQARGVHWVEPTLVGEVQFTEWTREGVVRQAAFLGLRTDKPAAQIIHEQPRTAKSLEKPKKPKAKTTESGVKVTHPERVIDTQSGTQKQQLAQFYAGISQWILPFLRSRPVSLLRAPEGIEGEQFFQKHSERMAIPHIKQLDQALDPGHARLMEIDSRDALVGAVQMGTVELHTWGATTDKIETPDLFVLDLDPDPALPWKAMLEAAQLTLSVLDELGLQAFVKTSGGKGLHLIVPLARRDGWDTVKAFAKAMAQFMTQQLPERFTATSGPKNRVGKIFIDYLRNARGASTVAAYSVRARPGLPVSVPVSRDELKDLRGAQQWTVANLHERLQGLKEDPWAGYANRQKISKKMWDRLGAKPPQ